MPRNKKEIIVDGGRYVRVEGGVKYFSLTEKLKLEMPERLRLGIPKSALDAIALRETIDLREIIVLIKRFGLNGGGPATLKEVGEILGISGESVRRIEAKALKKLRRPLRREAGKKLLRAVFGEEDEDVQS